MKRLFVVISIKKIVIVLCVKKHMHYSVWIFLTKGVFVVNFRKNSSAAGVCGTDVTPGQKGAVKRLIKKKKKFTGLETGLFLFGQSVMLTQTTYFFQVNDLDLENQTNMQLLINIARLRSFYASLLELLRWIHCDRRTFSIEMKH
jgi:hypothetical protein